MTVVAEQWTQSKGISSRRSTASISGALQAQALHSARLQCCFMPVKFTPRSELHRGGHTSLPQPHTLVWSWPTKTEKIWSPISVKGCVGHKRKQEKQPGIQYRGGASFSSKNSSILLTSVFTSPSNVMKGGFVPGARFCRSAGFLMGGKRWGWSQEELHFQFLRLIAVSCFTFNIAGCSVSFLQNTSQPAASQWWCKNSEEPTFVMLTKKPSQTSLLYYRDLLQNRLKSQLLQS